MSQHFIVKHLQRSAACEEVEDCVSQSDQLKESFLTGSVFLLSAQQLQKEQEESSVIKVISGFFKPDVSTSGPGELLSCNV
ncbi:hypothetical protein ILYODFUR_029620 [Ilyodon furcidens]|uniref:Uncharacterized protein n=1 Tax=Ilyodon furcidens TaxID=33524 RepID=A0ABV0TFM1_9TELE